MIKAALALMVLQFARRDARSVGGRLVLLADQDRSSWHHDEIEAGLQLLMSLRPTEGYAEELRLQALIAALHDAATTAERTDWRLIADAYARLDLLTGSPVVRLNRAVAVAEADGAPAGIALLDGLDEQLPGSHRLPAVRAELLRRSGDAAGARLGLRLSDRALRQRGRAHPSDPPAGLALVRLSVIPGTLTPVDTTAERLAAGTGSGRVRRNADEFQLHRWSIGSSRRFCKEESP